MKLGSHWRPTIPFPDRSVFLTGFGPFPGVLHNATAELVPRLAAAARERWPSLHVLAEVLPTEWRGAPARVGDVLKSHRPMLALHFGAAKEAQGFEIECKGRNRCRLAPDNAGVVPSVGRLFDEGADCHVSNLPVERIVARLKGIGLPARASEDAGGYVCNSLFYHSLRHVEAAGAGIQAGFVHVPACLSGAEFDGGVPPPTCPLTWEQAVGGALEIIDVVLNVARA